MQRIKVLVKTRAGKSEVLGFDNEKNAYRVSVKAMPEHGEANLEVMKLLRKHFKLPARIVSGFTSKEKSVELG